MSLYSVGYVAELVQTNQGYDLAWVLTFTTSYRRCMIVGVTSFSCMYGFIEGECTYVEIDRVTIRACRGLFHVCVYERLHVLCKIKKVGTDY